MLIPNSAPAADEMNRLWLSSVPFTRIIENIEIYGDWIRNLSVPSPFQVVLTWASGNPGGEGGIGRSRRRRRPGLWESDSQFSPITADFRVLYLRSTDPYSRPLLLFSFAAESPSPSISSAESASYEVLIGNRSWMQQNGLIVTDDMEDAMRQHEEKGQTAILIGINGRLTELHRKGELPWVWGLDSKMNIADVRTLGASRACENVYACALWTNTFCSNFNLVPRAC